MMDRAPFRLHVFCCVNEREEGHPRGCCKAKGADALRDHFKRRCKALGLDDVRINQAGCLDFCELGPVIVVYPQGIWYRADTIADIDQIVDQHIMAGTPVERLIIGTLDASVPAGEIRGPAGAVA
jgi:(2Fe-2S) ferredoxin